MPNTIIWRKWKLLGVCLGNPWVAHGCWYSPRSHHTWRHIHTLATHHQGSLLNLVHLSMPQMLA